MIYESILSIIGNTPIVHLSQLSAELNIQVYAKLESLNPGGSHKVRIAFNMVMEAQRQGVLKPHTGQTIIEPSGGNTGMGLAMVANQLGYNVILVIPDNYSVEKQRLLKLFGAEIVLSNSKKGNNSHGELALEMALKNPRYVLLNQQRNPANPDSHRKTTAPEIIRDFPDTTIDYFVGGIGTGGHITGIGEILKTHWPNLKVFGVEPKGSNLLANVHVPHNIQGLSVGLIPDTLNVDILDGMINVSTEDCVNMAKKIILEESISLGISSAANFVAIQKLSKTIPEGSEVLTLVYDNVDAYLSYFEELG